MGGGEAQSCRGASWLVFVASSQGKLRENLPRIGQCRVEIEAVCDSLQAELNRIKAQLMEKVEELERYFGYLIEEAVNETSRNACNGAYSPTTYLAYQVWTHACQKSSEPLCVFTYKSRPNVEFLQECMGISFENSIPGLESLKWVNPTEIARVEAPLKETEEGLKQEIAILRDKLETLQLENHAKDEEIEDFKRKLSETEKLFAEEKDKTRQITEKEGNL